MTFDRRTFLERGTGAALASVGLASLSGCSAVTRTLGGGGGSTHGARKSWLYEPDTVIETDHYQFFQAAPIAIDEREDALDETLFERLEAFENRWTYADVDFDEMKSLLQFSSSVVIQSELSNEDIVEELEDNEFDDEEELNGFTVYLSENESTGVGVNGSTVVVGSRTAEEDAEEVVVETIDTKNGETARYVDENDAMAKLSNELGGGDVVYGQTHEPVEEALTEIGETIIGGTLVQGALTAEDPFYPDSSHYYDGYSFFADRGTEITVEMVGEGEQPWVAIENADGEFVATQNQYGSGGSGTPTGNAPREYSTTLEYTVESSGLHRIVATSGQSERTFPYRLKMESTAGERPLGSFEGSVAHGSRLSLGEDTTERKWVFVFEDDGADEGDLEDWADDDPVAGEYDDVSVSTKSGGSVGVVTGTIDTDDVVYVGIDYPTVE